MIQTLIPFTLYSYVLKHSISEITSPLAYSNLALILLVLCRLCVVYGLNPCVPTVNSKRG